MFVFCLDCEQIITLEYKPKTGERVVCPGCEAEMEIVGTDPVQLDWAYNNTPKVSHSSNKKINWSEAYRLVSGFST